MEFKERLAREIRDSGLTQKEVAEKVGCAPSMVGFWLRGSQPRLPHYERLIAVFPALHAESVA